MPWQLGVQHVESVYSWPLGRIMARRAAGEGWTDCLVILCEAIRLGGSHNSRRVRYDGRLYITHNGRNVYLDGELTALALDHVSHVYGLCDESDKLHNLTLKGY